MNDRIFRNVRRRNENRNENDMKRSTHIVFLAQASEGHVVLWRNTRWSEVHSDSK